MSVSLIMTKGSNQQLEKPQFDFKVGEITHEEEDNSELATEIDVHRVKAQ